MKRVLYIGGFELPDKNAAAHRVMANALLLNEMGYEVMFIGPSKGTDSVQSTFNNFRCEFIKYPRTLIEWILYVCKFISVRRILSYRPDYVILYNFPAIASLKILRVCHKNGIKVFQDLTEWESAVGWAPRQIIRKLDINLRMHYCVKKMDGVIAISRYLYDYYKPYTNCIFIPPTVDLNNSKWNRSRELTASKPVKLVYAGTGGFGVKDKLDVIVDSVKDFDKIHLTIIGMTKDKYESGYGPIPKGCMNVEFKGRISHLDAIKAVCEADFQMLIRDNTLKNKAGFPTKFVESISCCTPLIVTLTSNIGEYIKDGYLGFVVNEKQTLRDIFLRVISMSNSEIVSMKKQCYNCTVFDYHNYKEEFSKLFCE